VDGLMWLAIPLYTMMFLLSVFSTIGQGLSGYFERCFGTYTLYLIAHVCMGIIIFQLHVIFIHTHHGLTFYQWILIKFRLLTKWNASNIQRDHLNYEIRGFKTTNQKYGDRPNFEEIDKKSRSNKPILDSSKSRQTTRQTDRQTSRQTDR
ncbi:hypothetical protein PFISCL1PPCAC_22820, partial [Pristionchus fissidentatus]